MSKRKVGAGETTSSIAKKKGFFWRTIWEHGENAALKAKRKDPNVLFADDDIFIPEKQMKEVSKGCEQEHPFTLKGEPAKLKMQLLKVGKPRPNVEYVLEVDGELTDGKTDDDGKLEHWISPDAKSATLIMKNGREKFSLKLGNLDPIDLISGIQQRLNNLHYSCGGEKGEIGDLTKQALKEFQADYKLEATGEADGATKAKLKELCK